MSWLSFMIPKWGKAPLKETQTWVDPNPRPQFNLGEELEPTPVPVEEEVDLLSGRLISQELLFCAKGTLYSQQEATGAYAPLFGSGDNEELVLAMELREVPKSKKPSTNFSIVVNRGGEEMLCGFYTGLTYSEETGAVLWEMLRPDGLPGQLKTAFRFAAQPCEGKPVSPAELCRRFIHIYNTCIYCSLSQYPLPARKPRPPSGSSSDAFVAHLEDLKSDDDVDYVSSLASYQVPSASTPAEASPKATGTAATGKVSGSATYDADELYSFDEAALTTSKTGLSGANVAFADSVQYSRAIVVNSATPGVASKEVTFQAHNYNERGMTGEHSSFTLKPAGDKSINPGQMILADGERKALLVDTVTKQLQEIDLEHAKVVQSYNPGLDYAVLGVSHMDKFGDTDPNVLACLNRTTAFCIDRRLDPKSCAVVESGKTLNDYMHKPKKPFTCHATSAKGQLAIGDSGGNIRLFTGPPGSRRPNGSYHPKTAKTLLKGSPDEPILHLDISADGQYVLATCKTYLLVLCTMYDTDGKTLCGFEGRMGDSKPLPLKLTLTPAQQMEIGGPQRRFQFGKGHFQLNANGEHWISASAGPYLVTWNFDSVKKALLRHEAVVADTRSIGRAAVRDAVIGRHAQETVTFMTDDAVGMQGRASVRKSGKFSVRFA